MATFSAIVSTEYAVGAPITSSWGSKVSNNVLAIIQGDATASSNRIQEAALSAAVIAQLVTNGDSHNHSGGDGAAIPNASVTGLGSLALLNSVAAAQIDANAVGQSEIAASAVGQSELKTSTQSDTILANPARRTMTGGRWTLWVDMSAGSFIAGYATVGDSNNVNTIQTAADIYTQAASISTRLYGINGYYAGDTATFNWEYITASPPYDLGDGDIPLFIFLEIDNATGNVIGVSVAEDPPWAYNGKTNTKPDSYKKVNGVLVPYQKKLDIDLCLSECLDNPAHMERYCDFMKAPKYISTEITQEIKNRDMPDIPHNLTDCGGEYIKGKSVVMVDPMSKLGEALLNMHINKEDVGGLFINKKIIVGNDKLNRCGSECNHIVPIRWSTHNVG